MNINYDEIIEKASIRAEKLKEIQLYGARAEEHATAMLNGMLYFANLNNRVQALDSEGRAMIASVASRAQAVGSRCSNYYEVFTQPERVTRANTMVVMSLVEALK